MHSAEAQRNWYATNDRGYLKNKFYKIVDRCTNPKNVHFDRYGGRGIYVCLDWFSSPDAFVDWALTSGWKRGLEIDRTNNDGPYSPDNCRWVTPKENRRNSTQAKLSMEKASRIRRLVMEGYAVKSITAMYGVNKSTIYKLLKNKLWA